MRVNEIIDYFQELIDHGHLGKYQLQVYTEAVSQLRDPDRYQRRFEYLKERVREAATEMPFDDIEFFSHRDPAVFAAAIRDVNEWSDKTLREVEGIV